MRNIYLCSIVMLSTGTICPAQVTFTQFPAKGPVGITAGPDGNLWYTDGFASGSNIGRITPSGTITLFPVPSGDSEGEIAAGPDGNLWFPEYRTNKIGRITPAGVITEFPVSPGGNFYGITAGPDGNMWFTNGTGATIGRITTAGVVTQFAVPGGTTVGITAGPDGNLWFTENSASQIGRITTAGTVVEFPLPTSGSYPAGITLGPDGNLWFTEQSANQIGRITPSGTITEFPIPPGTGPVDITTGPDGNLWFTENGLQIGRITTDGATTAFSVPSIGSGLITLGPDGNLWFTDFYGNQIFRLMIFPPGAFQVKYAANLNVGDSWISVTNTGASGGNLCANIYTFDPAEELISCCACSVTPNALQSLSVLKSLVSNPLTPAIPNAVVVKVVASSGTCNASSVASNKLAAGLLAWGTTLHQVTSNPVASYGVTETAFSIGDLTVSELAHITSTCGFIQANGSGFGICKGCAAGGLGASQRYRE